MLATVAPPVTFARNLAAAKYQEALAAHLPEHTAAHIAFLTWLHAQRGVEMEFDTREHFAAWVAAGCPAARTPWLAGPRR